MKIIGVAFLIANLICVPCIYASTNHLPEPKTSVSPFDKTSVSGFNANPDLVIEDIVKKPSDIIFIEWLYCRVKNIGDVTAEGWIDIEVDVIWMLFGKIPIKIVKSFTGNAYLEGGVQPGEAIDIFFAEEEWLPRFGFYKLSSVVNPNGNIPEKDLGNNFYEESFFVLFGRWFWLE